VIGGEEFLDHLNTGSGPGLVGIALDATQRHLERFPAKG
jgi:hypothetical protein